MFYSDYNWTPAAQAALGISPDGPPMEETWSYRSLVRMLLYLSTNTSPDIALAVSQSYQVLSQPKEEPRLRRQGSCLLFAPHQQNGHDCQAHRQLGPQQLH